ncbi:MAG: uncharacterized protein KVP18_000416 [Porospora cf. gigantea A]|uniref:uncharacterized protein n=2 Tax=Porospora cf. gigantea A TaxID=2853593 RepID=UPI00355A7009|nr:MAG: hypothetical protein KVP18_000416 [Porospora cf. gigantea A]
MLASCGQFEFLAAQLMNRGFCVIAFDFFGHGLSSDLPDQVEDSALLLVEQVRDVLQAAGVPASANHSVLGFSMGGYVAVRYTGQFPQLVDRLVLLAPAGLISRPWFISVLHSRAFAACQPVVTRFLAALISRCDHERTAHHYNNPPRLHSEPADWKEVSVRNLRTVITVGRTLKLWGDQHAFDSLGQCNVTMLFGWGDKDYIVPFKYYEETLRQRYPSNLTIATFGGAGHVLLSDMPFECVRVVRDFLAQPLIDSDDVEAVGPTESPCAFKPVDTFDAMSGVSVQTLAMMDDQLSSRQWKRSMSVLGLQRLLLQDGRVSSFESTASKTRCQAESPARRNLTTIKSARKTSMRLSSTSPPPPHLSSSDWLLPLAHPRPSWSTNSILAGEGFDQSSDVIRLAIQIADEEGEFGFDVE